MIYVSECGYLIANQLPLSLQAFQDNKIEGGAQNTITPFQLRFGVSIPANCIANGLPENPTANAPLPCDQTAPMPFLLFTVSVPAGTPECKCIACISFEIQPTLLPYTGNGIPWPIAKVPLALPVTKPVTYCFFFFLGLLYCPQPKSSSGLERCSETKF